MYELTERELDEVMALFQDGPLWNSKRLTDAIPFLVAELRKRRGTEGPTQERDRRNTYPRVQNGTQSQVKRA